LQSDKYLKDFKQTLANTNTTLVNQAASITDKVGSFQKTASSIATDVVAPLYRLVGGQYKSTAAGYDSFRNTAVFVLLALPCLALLAAFAGAALVSPVPFTAYYWVGYIASFFVFLLFAVHLPLAVVVQDTCAYMASVDADFGKVDALGDGGTFLNASIYNRSLIDAFNLSAQLDFVNQINFDVPDVRANFTFAPITNFTSAVLALSLQTFGFDAQLLTNALVALNATSSLCSPPGAYTRANVQSCASAACPTASNSPAFWVRATLDRVPVPVLCRSPIVFQLFDLVYCQSRNFAVSPPPGQLLVCHQGQPARDGAQRCARPNEVQRDGDQCQHGLTAG
jgi:hypothetical protein